MFLKNIHELITLVLAMFASLLICLSVYKSKNRNIIELVKFFGGDKETDQNFVFWGFSILIDALTLITTRETGGTNLILNIVYLAGSISMTLILLRKKKMAFGWPEIFVGVLTPICLFIWLKTGDDEIGMIAFTTAVCLAYFPQIVDTFREPKQTPRGIFFVFLLAEIFSLFSADDWSVKNCYYSFGNLFCGATVVLLTFRKNYRH